MAADPAPEAQGRASPLVLFGGTFDPVHVGHLRSALDLLDYLRVPAVTLVPGRVPPHRGAPSFPVAERLHMLDLATASLSGVIVDPRECLREGPSYTVETLRALRRERGAQVPMVLVMGADAFAGFDRWHCWRDIPALCNLLLLDRPGFRDLPLASPLQALLRASEVPDPQRLLSASAGLVHRAALTQLEVSATAIRDLLRRGRSVRYLVPDEVCEYLMKREVHA
jgi:nicotinate-nucleotide adenylyltransferase